MVKKLMPNSSYNHMEAIFIFIGNIIYLWQTEYQKYPFSPRVLHQVIVKTDLTIPNLQWPIDIYKSIFKLFKMQLLTC